MVFVIVLALVVLVVLYLVKSYNELVKLREMVKNSMANIAAQVESRWDAIESLIEATKKYSAHEADLLLEITSKRAGVTKNSSTTEVEKDDSAFSNALRNINMLAEAYPDLKASQVYIKTMNSVDSYEENVRMSRMIYNDTVTKLNMKIQSFPSSIVASMFGFVKEEYFKNTKEKAEMPSW